MPDLTFASHLGRAKVAVVILPLDLKMRTGTVQEVNDLKKTKKHYVSDKSRGLFVFPAVDRLFFFCVGQLFPHR